MTGFGQVHPLPGIWDSFHVDSAVTLPIGVEAYAAYALRAWLSTGSAVSAAARRFARWSALGSLLLGMAGQVAYHLLTEQGTARAPWAITTAVSCLPVLVLGMGAALAHLLRSDAPNSGHDEPVHRVPPGGPADRDGSIAWLRGSVPGSGTHPQSQSRD
jgi:cytochrome bd-type quinol oxidase subunit 2